MTGPHPPPEPAPAAAGGPLVGRDRELARLGVLLRTAFDGRGALALIGGEAGIGKTALAEAIGREAADHGALVFVGRCYDLAETPPYGPWADLLADRAADDGPAPPPLGVGDDPAGGVASQAALFTRVRDYLAALAARRPLVLLLEDLHWADPASLELLRALGRALDRLPLLLLATYRADELTREHPLYELLPALVREARAERLDLRPLSAGDLAELVRGRYPLPPADEARLVAYMLGRAEGNPFYAGELLRTLEEERALCAGDGGWALADLTDVPVPMLLRQVIDGRVARLGAQARRLLTLAAVIGHSTPLGLWRAVADADEEEVLATVEAAVAARLLVATADGARFAHALIREALYEDALPFRRHAWHRRVAEALLAAPTPDPDAVAHHFRQAGDPRAEAWLVRAGERAQAAYAWVTAAERYAAAQALLETNGGAAGRRGWLAFRAATLRRYADARGALGEAEVAARLAGEAGDPLLAAAADVLAGMLLAHSLGAPRRGLGRMEAGLAALGALPATARVPPAGIAPLDPAPRRGTVVSQLAWCGRHAEALALAEGYLAEVDAPLAADWLGGNPYADAHVGLGMAYAALGQPARSRAAFARARELNHGVGHHQQAWLVTLAELEVAMVYQADVPAELRRLREAAAAAAARARGAGAAVRPENQRPQLLALAGRWAEARDAAEAMRAAVAPGAHQHVLASAALGTLDRERGEGTRAGARVAEALPDGPETPLGDRAYPHALALQRLAATLALDAGDTAGARAWLAAHDRWLDWGGAVAWRAEGFLGWAAYHRAAGNLALAHQHAELALVRASEPRQPVALLAAHRLLGELDTTTGRPADAAAHLDLARALADACEAPYEQALTLLALADLYLATGERQAAQAALDEARPILARLEAWPALARADGLAAGLAAPSSSSGRPAAPASLSPREVEVLRLLAEGATDPAIARELSISVRTVNKHVASILGKTGSANRAAAAAFAVRHVLGEDDGPQ